MTSASESLDDLRQEIDRIDTNMHDLLMRRAELVDRIKTVKGRDHIQTVKLDREAAILRRLYARHEGRFPKGAISRIWREIISAITQMEDSGFSIAVYADAENPGYWDVARDQFGSLVPMATYANSRDVLSQVMEGKATIGVLPCPTELRPESWWTLLLVPGAPRIVYRIPFAEAGNARQGSNGMPDAFLVARFEPEPTDKDRSLLVLEMAEHLSRAALGEIFSRIRLTPRLLTVHEGPSPMLFAEIDGFIPSDDPRLEFLAARDSVHRVMGIGGYPVPLLEQPALGGAA